MTERVAFYSAQDESVNFVLPSGAECRYVHRPGADYAIIYLSSHNGCDQACRMCHLTQTGQTLMDAVSVTGYEAQALLVMEHFKQLPQEKKAGITHFHVNFMARGEPLLNWNLVKRWNLLTPMIRRAVGLPVQFNISTIYPKSFHHADLVNLIANAEPEDVPTIYYSAYSADPAFRRRWLPKALPIDQTLDRLALLQILYNLKVVIHHALIRNHNDHPDDAGDLGRLIDQKQVKARFNLVRYNPYSEVQGEEPSEKAINLYFQRMIPHMTEVGSRIVPRVGPDVKASCGTFMGAEQVALVKKVIDSP